MRKEHESVSITGLRRSRLSERPTPGAINCFRGERPPAPDMGNAPSRPAGAEGGAPPRPLGPPDEYAARGAAPRMLMLEPEEMLRRQRERGVLLGRTELRGVAMRAGGGPDGDGWTCLLNGHPAASFRSDGPLFKCPVRQRALWTVDALNSAASVHLYDTDRAAYDTALAASASWTHFIVSASARVTSVTAADEDASTHMSMGLAGVNDGPPLVAGPAASESDLSAGSPPSHSDAAEDDGDDDEYADVDVDGAETGHGVAGDPEEGGEPADEEPLRAAGPPPSDGRPPAPTPTAPGTASDGPGSGIAHEFDSVLPLDMSDRVGIAFSLPSGGRSTVLADAGISWDNERTRRLFALAMAARLNAEGEEGGRTELVPFTDPTALLLRVTGVVADEDIPLLLARRPGDQSLRPEDPGYWRGAQVDMPAAAMRDARRVLERRLLARLRPVAEDGPVALLNPNAHGDAPVCIQFSLTIDWAAVSRSPSVTFAMSE